MRDSAHSEPRKPPSLLARAVESAEIDKLGAAPPARVLVASDLHLNVGLDPLTAMYDARENFLADEAFSRWLAYFRRGPSPPTTLPQPAPVHQKQSGWKPVHSPPAFPGSGWTHG